jgi:signal recognition particle receptor subunit beta
MVLFNYSTKEITAKIVYYGPGLCGKTTNLQFIYDNLPATINKGRMLSLATKTDRTLFFDFLPIDLGTIRGLRTRLQLYTVPGQVFYNTTRKLVLKGSDGVVFVADSQKRMMEANLESFRNLEENLAEHDMKISEMPLILQFNKRDLPDVATLEELNAALNKYNAPIYEAVATTGIGVHETLRAATRLVLNSLKERYAERREERVEPGVQAAALAAAQMKTPRRAPAAEAADHATRAAPPADKPAEPAAPPVHHSASPATAPVRRPGPTPPPEPDLMSLEVEEDGAPGLSLDPLPATRGAEQDEAEPVLELSLDEEVAEDVVLEVADEAGPLEIEESVPLVPAEDLTSGVFDETPPGSFFDDEASLSVAAPDPLARAFAAAVDEPAALSASDTWPGTVDDEPLAAAPAEDLSGPVGDIDSPFGAEPSRVEESGEMSIPLALEEEGVTPIIALEDSHDGMLAVDLESEPVREITAPLTAGAPGRVVSVEAAAAGPREILVPIELAIGGQSIRFDLRIHLDLGHATTRPATAPGLEERAR